MTMNFKSMTGIAEEITFRESSAILSMKINPVIDLFISVRLLRLEERADY